MAKASEMIDKSSPSVKEMVKEDPLQGKMSELRNQYQAESSNAAITKSEKPPPWEDWLSAKGYGLVNGFLTRK